MRGKGIIPEQNEVEERGGGISVHSRRVGLRKSPSFFKREKLAWRIRCGKIKTFFPESFNFFFPKKKKCRVKSGHLI